MSKSHEQRTTITAVIPHEDAPDFHLVGTDRQYPTQEHPDGQTYERTFRDMGRALSLGRGTLSVAERLFGHEDEAQIVYLAKPIPGIPQDRTDLLWKRTRTR